MAWFIAWSAEDIQKKINNITRQGICCDLYYDNICLLLIVNELLFSSTIALRRQFHWLFFTCAVIIKMPSDLYFSVISFLERL